MSENNENYYIWLYSIADDEEIPAWKRLEIVTRKWATLTRFEKDQDNYRKMKGIGTMHKSNAVPIFTDTEAKEISSMRR